MEHIIYTHAVQILSPLLMAAVTWASTRLAQLISARIRSERVRAVLDRLDDAILAITGEIQQVTIGDIKALTPDGQLPPSVRARLKVASVATVKAYLGPKGVDEALRVLALDASAFESFVRTRIEAAVFALKRGQDRNGVHKPAELTATPTGGNGSGP